MGKYKDYIMDYQKALAGRSLPQVRNAEEIAKRVKRTKIQEQKMLSIIDRKHKQDNSDYFIKLMQKLN